MTPDEIERPATEAAKAEPAPPAKPVPPKPVDELDPMGWEVPLICKDCGKDFRVPYRHFRAGVVFHCRHCHGSFVPKMTMDRTVRETFEPFYAKRRREREEFARTGGDETAFRRKQQLDLDQFHKLLDQIALEMRPAGKMVKPKGLAAMFT
jgi:hypothetical protein